MLLARHAELRLAGRGRDDRETDRRGSTFEGTITAALREGAGDHESWYPKARSRDVALTGPHGLLQALTQPMTETLATATWVTTPSGPERAEETRHLGYTHFRDLAHLKWCSAPTGRAAHMTEATAFDVSRSQWLRVDENFLIWLSGSPHTALRQ